MNDERPGSPPDPDAGIPPIQDAEGYLLQPRDAAFVGVTVESLQALAARAYPLGFASVEEWQLCCKELRAALQADGLTDADVRLKGSAASFFSLNPEKRFPQNGADCRAQAETNALDGAAAEASWSRSPYAGASVLPNRCFWDCRRLLDIEREASDYDIQISSEILAEKIRTRYPERTYRGRSIVSEHGGHFTGSALKRVCPALGAWSARWQAGLGRQINLAGFSAAGPSSPISHFSDQDWVILA